jgi:hypothetical protein
MSRYIISETCISGRRKYFKTEGVDVKVARLLDPAADRYVCRHQKIWHFMHWHTCIVSSNNLHLNDSTLAAPLFLVAATWRTSGCWKQATGRALLAPLRWLKTCDYASVFAGFRVQAASHPTGLAWCPRVSGPGEISTFSYLSTKDIYVLAPSTVRCSDLACILF